MLATFICADVGYHHWYYGVRVGSYESRCQVDIVGVTPRGGAIWHLQTLVSTASLLSQE